MLQPSNDIVVVPSVQTQVGHASVVATVGHGSGVVTGGQVNGIVVSGSKQFRLKYY